MAVTGACARQTFSGHDIEDMGINVYGGRPLPSDTGMEAPAFPNGFADYAKVGFRQGFRQLTGRLKRLSTLLWMHARNKHLGVPAHSLPRPCKRLQQRFSRKRQEAG